MRVLDEKSTTYRDFSVQSGHDWTLSKTLSRSVQPWTILDKSGRRLDCGLTTEVCENKSLPPLPSPFFRLVQPSSRVPDRLLFPDSRLFPRPPRATHAPVGGISNRVSTHEKPRLRPPSNQSPTQAVLCVTALCVRRYRENRRF